MTQRLRYGSLRAGRLAWIAAITTSCLTSPLLAQSAPTPGAEAAAESEGVGEILVTARRRVESLQSTPVSVSVLSDASVREQNLRNFQDLRGAVSNLEVQPMASGGASITIRGIGQTSGQVNVDSKAGFYIDDMYVARQEGNDLYFYDIASLQVLKGPQGTLFGKNTTGGALLLTTARPSDDESGYIQLRAGTYKRVDLEGAINVPLSPKVLTRFSFRTQNADGFVKHVLNDDTSNNVNNQSARFQIRLLPTDAFTIDLLTEYNRNRSDGSTSIAVGCRPTAAYMLNYYDPRTPASRAASLHSQSLCDAYPILNQGNTVYGGAYLTIPTSAAVTDRAVGGDANSLSRGNLGPHSNVDVGTVNLRMNYDLNDNLSVKSITAYRYSQSRYYNPTVNVPTDIYAEFDDTNTKQFTQEFNLSGKLVDNRLDFVLGAFYSYQNTRLLQDTGPDWIDPLGYIYDGKNKFESWAAYGQASFKITPKLELTAGGRFTYDKKKASSFVFFANNTTNTFIGTLPGASGPTTLSCGGGYNFVRIFLGGVKNCAGAPFTGADKDSWTSFDPRVQLSYQVASNFFVYGSWTKGYNAGGFNQQLGSNILQGRLLPYEPERLTSYEAGFKSDWLDRKLRFNLTGFYQDYQDIQTTVLVNLSGIDTRQVQTGATAEAKGFEAELTVQPIDALTITANGSYLEQKYTSVRPGVSFTVDTPVNSAPKYTYSVAGNYVVPLMGESTVTFNVNWRYIDEKAACNPVGSCYTPGYGLLGGRIDFAPSPDSPWMLSLWGTNMLDKKVEISRNYGGSMGIDSYIPGRPAEFGVEVRRKF